MNQTQLFRNLDFRCNISRWIVSFLKFQKSWSKILYSKIFSAVAPCNRDIFLIVNGLANVGSQANYQKEINFIANQLTPTWNVGLDKVRVMLNLQVIIWWVTRQKTYQISDRHWLCNCLVSWWCSIKCQCYTRSSKYVGICSRCYNRQ